MKDCLTRQQADTMARFLLTIRPDWSLHYTREAVWAMQEISDSPERIWRVAIRGAYMHQIRKPDVLAMNGEHWKAQADLHAPSPSPGGRRRCCGGFHAEPPAGEPDALCVRSSVDYESGPDAARAAIKQTRRYDLSTPLQEGTTP